MVVSVLVVAILALFISLAFCFASYHFFRLLIALWGFFVGFLLTTQALATSAGSHVLVSTVGVIIAVIVSLIVAALAYWLYVAAVVILSVSVGFWIGSRLMIAIGYGSHSIPALLIGMLVAVILALLTLALNLAKWLIILSTALGGASTIIAAVLLLLRVIPPDNLSLGLVGAIIRGSPLWGMVCLVLTDAGLLVQVRSTQQYAQDYAHAQF